MVGVRCEMLKFACVFFREIFRMFEIVETAVVEDSVNIALLS